MALTLRERLCKRLTGLKDQRKPFEQEWREISSYGQPARSRFLVNETNKNKTRFRNKLNNSHGIFAFRTLQGGMTSGLSSASRPWFSLASTDEDLEHDQEVKEYLSEVETRMYAFLAQTNFYSAVKTGYLEMGMFGTEACVMVEHPIVGAVCHQLTAGEYWIGLGSALTPEALYRDCPMTVVQAVQRFNRPNLSQFINDAYDRGDYDIVCEFKHAIEVNDEQDPFSKDFRGMKYRSVYWDDKDQRRDQVADQRGYHEQPFWAPRWDTTGGDSWGCGPGHDALPDLRELQLQAKRKGEATDMHIWPEMITSPRIKLKRQPKAVTSAAEMDFSKAIYVPYEVPYQAIEAVRQDLEACKDSINQATYADLFMAITNMAGIQPRNIEEIAARNEEKLTQLGPVIERVNNEKLQVAIDRTFSIMERAGLLPPAPDKIAQSGGNLKVEFVSILTQMQRMVGLGQIERTFQFVGSILGSYPEARHKLDAIKAVDEYARRAGMPAKLIKTDDEAMAATQAEQQAQQQAQQAEMAAKMAPAAKAGAEAAQTASTLNMPAPLGAPPPGGTPGVDAAQLLASMPVGKTPAGASLVPEYPR